jgi:quercetin dioxygenase-like cupin family protein
VSSSSLGSPFPSFFIGGFESSTAILSDGRRLDVARASQHDRQLAADYDLLREAGILTVRESVRWPMVDRGGRLQLAGVRRMAALLHERSMVSVWDLMHYGFPDGVDPYSPAFVERFARYARAVAQVLVGESGPGNWYTPINEISFMAHAAGDIGLFAPFSRGRGWDIKLQLVRAAVAAMEAIREMDAEARFLHVDPLIRLHPQTADPAEADRVRDFNERIVFEGWHMLRGAVMPELGGRTDFLTVAGLNVYKLCQWELDHEGSFLAIEDPRWMPVREMLRDAWQRLKCPIIVGETGELGPARTGWLRYLLSEVNAAREAGVAVLGVCWYPVISAPDWYDPTTLFEGGWWDSVPRGRRLTRVPVEPILEIVREEQERLGERPATERRDGFQPALQPGNGVPSEQPAPIEVHRLPRRRTPESWERRLLTSGEDLSVSVYRFAPGRAVGIRSYADAEIVLTVLEGTVTLFGWDHNQTLTAGSVAYVPRGRPFGLHNPGKSVATVTQVASPAPWNSDLHAVESRRPKRPRWSKRAAGRPSVQKRSASPS